MVRIFLLCKRYYTNKDLLEDRFGRLYHLPVELNRLGNSVSVKAIDYRNPYTKATHAEGVIFHTAPATPAKLPLLVFDLYRAIQSAQPEILITSGDSHIGYIGLRIAKRLQIRFVYDVYDYYPAFSGNRIPGMKYMFRSAAKKADLVLCASDSLQLTLSNLNIRTKLIENGVDRKLFVPGNMKQARRKLSLEQEAPLIGYFGSITSTRGPLLIDACRRLRKAIPSLRLILAGRITDVVINEPWISYLGELPQDSISELICACNVVTIPYSNDTFNSLAGACKIAEYLACGKPVVATRVSGHEHIFKDAPQSLCEPNSEDMARALHNQLISPEIVPFPETMDWKHIGRVLHESLNTLIQ